MNSLNILYEDNHVIVVEKPINVLSQSDITHDMDLLTMVKNYIREKYNKPGNVYIGLVHRLDRPVGGVMVFAKTSKAAQRLSKQIIDGQFEKKYLAVIEGLLPNDLGDYCDRLLKLSNGNTIVDSKGKESFLSYRVLEKNYRTNQTLVEISLKTGRHHQIRVQFASRGFPLCGDKRYGFQKGNTQLALFAYQLSFFHPVTKELLEFQITPPKKEPWTQFTL